MNFKEAYYKQKEEILRLEKVLEKNNKEIVANKQVQKLLDDIQELNNKVLELDGIMKRYKDLYEKQQKISEEKASMVNKLEEENRYLQWHIDCLENKKNSSKLTAAQEAKEEIAALKDEVARLSAKLDANSVNAGISTSKTAINQTKRIPNSRKKSTLRKGGQPGHKKHEMPLFSKEEITDTVEHNLDRCPKCGNANINSLNTIIKDEYDYKVVVKKIRHKFIEYKCPVCNSVFRSPYNGLVNQNQYGNTIQALALSLMNLGFVSINRTRKIITGFSQDDIALTEGYLSKLQKRYSKKLKSFIEEAKQSLLLSPLLYWDDTVIFVNTNRACMRFYGTEKIALYTSHLHKNLKSVMEDDILPTLTNTTTVMHDHNTINYHNGFLFRNVECLQHLERDLQKIFDLTNHPWAKELKESIAMKIHERKELIEKGIGYFSKDSIECFLNKVSDIIKLAHDQWSNDQNCYFSKEEKALITRLETYKQNYFEWINDFLIPTTNNLSERSLRFVKIKDKVSGQFQNIEHAKYFADIRTYIETCSRNGVNEFDALLRLTKNNPYTIAELLKLNT